jgi:hypothetical protein
MIRVSMPSDCLALNKTCHPRHMVLVLLPQCVLNSDAEPRPLTKLTISPFGRGKHEVAAVWLCLPLNYAILAAPHR